MIKRLAALALLAGLASAPAVAVTYDAFASFDGTQGAGGFVYGYGSDGYSDGALFAATSNCFIAGSICLQQSANGDVPGVTKSTATSFQYGSVNVPDDRLLLHPGSDGATNGTVFVAFTAPASGFYNYSIAISIQDIHPTGVVVGSFFNVLSPPPFTLLLNGANPSYGETGSLFLGAGQSFGLTFNRNGNYGSDSIGLNFTLSAVPEPATWGLMIVGFTGVGIAARRRKVLAA